MAGSASSEAPQGGVDVHARGLGHAYRTPEGPLTVLRDLELDIGAGGYVAIGGPSGSGKSTLLSLLGGLEAPRLGSLRVGDVNLRGLAGNALADYRRRTVGFVFQHFGLLDTLSALENVELACMLARVPPRVRRARARDLLAAVGLADRAWHRPPALSGGEQQRVAIARALANRPRLLLADEPTGNLDEESATLVASLLEKVQSERGCSLVIVTHNRRLAARAPVRLSLADGRLRAA